MKQFVVFVHGGQGCGKSSITNQLRELWTHTTLLRLAGVPSGQEYARDKSCLYHMSMLEGMRYAKGTGMNFVVDRSFLCEKIYANLGFKSYDYEREARVLREGLKYLAEEYEVYFVLLTASEGTLRKRLNRGDKPQFEEVVFEASNSLRQQSEYLKEFALLPSCIHQIHFATDGKNAKINAKILKDIIESKING